MDNYKHKFRWSRLSLYVVAGAIVYAQLHGYSWAVWVLFVALILHNEAYVAVVNMLAAKIEILDEKVRAVENELWRRQ